MAYSALPNCQLAKVFLNIAGPAAVEENYCQRSSFCFHGTLIPSAQRLVWAAKQPLGKAALGALFA